MSANCFPAATPSSVSVTTQFQHQNSRVETFSSMMLEKNMARNTKKHKADEESALINLPSSVKNGLPIQAPLGDFHLFPKLPAEMRLKIWKFAPKPRIIQIQFTSRETEKLSETNPPSWRLVADIPAILQTCHEARKEGLNNYSLIYKDRKLPTSIGVHPSNNAYIDNDIDTLHIRGLGYLKALRSYQNLDVKSVTVPSNLAGWMAKRIPFFKDIERVCFYLPTARRTKGGIPSWTIDIRNVVPLYRLEGFSLYDIDSIMPTDNAHRSTLRTKRNAIIEVVQRLLDKNFWGEKDPEIIYGCLARMTAYGALEPTPDPQKFKKVVAKRSLQ
ncbi:hypothetical protein B0O99DRAFT_671033 [Bisporella sp. PMI_857]|nr:hypothetical protein B0O99DRAFT_671033 [Bisporella sp. PMI_857]